MADTLDIWYANLDVKQQALAHSLRELVAARGAGLQEALKWNQPCLIGNAMVCYIQKAKAHVALGFGRGTELSDPDGLLEGQGAQMRHVKLPLGGAVPLAALEKLLDQAIMLDRQR